MKRLNPCLLLAAMAAWLFLTAAVQAQEKAIWEAACQLFHGKRDCGSAVEVIDPKACIVAVRDRAYEKLAPEDAGCLIETVGARHVYLRSAGRSIKPVSVAAGAKDPVQLSVRLAGEGVVKLMTAHDEHGAPVWTPQDSWEFRPGGEREGTLAAITRLTDDLCPLQSVAAAPVSVPAEPVSIPEKISAKTAFEKAARGEVLLIDIRSRPEWQQSGIGEHAVPLTMHQDFGAFTGQLRKLAAERGNRPIALICAVGGRSHFMQQRLAAQGFDNVIDVKDGMAGNSEGPGWVASGLPVQPYSHALEPGL